MTSLFSKARFKDPLFYVALVDFVFWLADTYLKLFVLDAPRRMLWYSSMGLLFSAIAIFLRNKTLITAMFCALLVNEGLWSVSFLSQLFFGVNIGKVATYAFTKEFPKLNFYITIYHLLIIPSLLFALIKLKTVSKWGWLVAGAFCLTVSLLAFAFPDQHDNVNCVQRETVGICRIFFSPFYDWDPFWRIFFVTNLYTLVIFLPINLTLLVIFWLVWDRQATPPEELRR